MLFSVALASLLAPIVLACPDHSNHQNKFGKRQVTTDPGRAITDWAYEGTTPSLLFQSNLLTIESKH